MHCAVYSQPNSWPLASQAVSPWFKQNRPLRCSMQSHCENCRGRDGGHTPGMDGAGCHPLFPQALYTCNDLYSHCWEEDPADSQFRTQTGPAGEGVTTMCPGPFTGRKEGRVKSEQLFIWLEAAPFAWIQPP